MARRMALAPLLTLACAGLLAPAAQAATARAPQPPEPIFHVLGGRIVEASGLAVSADGERYYTLPDAGRPAEVYVIDGTGKTRATLGLPRAELNEDWEDLAAVRPAGGAGHLYIADTGDAFFTRRDAGLPPRTSYRLLRIAEPGAEVTGSTPVAEEDVTVFPLVYADGAAHNSEAMFVQPGTGRVFLVEKTEDAKRKTGLWSAPAVLKEDGDNTLRRVLADLKIVGVSGAAFSPSGDQVVIRNATTAYLWRIKDGDVARSLRAEPVEIELPLQKQGEGVAFTPDGRALLVNSEGGRQPVWRVPLAEETGTEAAEPPETTVESRDPAVPAPPPESADGLMLAVAGLSGTAAIGVLAFVVVRGRRAV
ncbi:hypothetical protein HS041_06555 [Planomonospora sp. ID67723]|uniref:hypothetical protein n=1 Tax=Planomonospora sp. ID67723 TaxID=2738134 RepID=UPI0018C44B00|nr:hypothetical protein [Planomonospora sp. ID67723]MBG0827423.1 hypothetical protein [Planomonospora sp. ID67723]